jgi:hypothetical protein
VLDRPARMQSQAPHRSRQQLCCAIKAIDASACCRLQAAIRIRTENRAPSRPPPNAR